LFSLPWREGETKIKNGKPKIKMTDKNVNISPSP
jgi:hypothetical protein